MYKIYKNQNGMLALINEEGRAVWLNTLQPIYNKVDVSLGWTEQKVVDPTVTVHEPLLESADFKAVADRITSRIAENRRF